MNRLYVCGLCATLALCATVDAASTDEYTTVQTIRIPFRKKMVVFNIDNAVGATNQNNITQINANSPEYHAGRSSQTPRAPKPLLGSVSWKAMAKTVWRHKIPACITAAAGLYGTLLLIIHYHAHAIANQHSWGVWHAELPLAALRQLPQSEMAGELHRAIKERYMTDPMSLTELDCIYCFMHDTKKEITHCTTLISLYEWIHHLHLTALAPSESNHLEQAHTALERLTFLRQVLNESIAPQTSVG